MYYLNPLPRAVLITPDEVIKQSSTDDKLDPRKLLNAIEIAEERFVRKALGWDLYESLCTEKNTLVTAGNISALQANINTTYGEGAVTLRSGDYVNAADTLSSASLSLWNNRLWKYTAECVRFVAMPEVYANFTSQGIMKNHPMISAAGGSGSEAASVSLADMKWLMDKWVGDRIDVLETALHEYVCRYIGDFGLYGRIADCASCGEENVATRRVGWITDLYDDEQGCCDDPPYTVPVTQSATIGVLRTNTYRFTAIDGQTQYPYPGQSNETAIRSLLINSELISLSREGLELSIGLLGDDEMIGLDNVTGQVEWNAPAMEGQRFILRVQKRS